MITYSLVLGNIEKNIFDIFKLCSRFFNKKGIKKLLFTMF